MEDTRRKKRIKTMKQLYSYSFHIKKSYKGSLYENIEKIDSIIAEAAPRYPIHKINKIDLAILRMSVYELCIEKKQPPKVIINEAIEIAKQYGNERSFQFINAVLAYIYENNK